MVIWRIARSLLEVYYAYMTVYRVELLLWAVATALPLIMLGLWVEAGQSGSFALSQAQMARYFLAVFLVRELTVVWVIHEFEWEVLSGKLSPLLLHPLDPAWRYVAMHLGEQAARLPLAVLLLGLCGWLYPIALHQPDGSWWMPGLGRAALTVLACYMAFTLLFLIQYTLALLAFWVERVAALEGLLYLPYLFLSGLVAPLEVFPPSVREWVLWTPFPYLVWFPARLLTGEEVVAAPGLAVLAGWIVLMFAVNRLVWRRGLRHYSAMGA